MKENEISKEEIQELQDNLDKADPIPTGMFMSRKSFKFITDSLRILDVEKYRIENGINFTNKNSSLFDYQARVTYSDGTSKIIALREEK